MLNETIYYLNIPIKYTEIFMAVQTDLKVVLLFPTFPTILPCSYFFPTFFLKYSYYSYFLNETKIKKCVC